MWGWPDSWATVACSLRGQSPVEEWVCSSALPGSEHGSFPRLMVWVGPVSCSAQTPPQSFLRAGSATGSSQQMALLRSWRQEWLRGPFPTMRGPLLPSSYKLEWPRDSLVHGVFFVHLICSSYRCIFCPCSKAVAINWDVVLARPIKPSYCLLPEQCQSAIQETKNSWKCFGWSVSREWVSWGSRKRKLGAWQTRNVIACFLQAVCDVSRRAIGTRPSARLCLLVICRHCAQRPGVAHYAH